MERVSSLRQSLKKLSFRRSNALSVTRPKEDDLSNSFVQYRGVSVKYLVHLARELAKGQVAGDLELFVLSENVSGVAVEGTTVHVLENASNTHYRVRVCGEDKLSEVPKSSVKEKKRKEWTVADVFDFFLLEEVRDQHVPYLQMIDRQGKFPLGKPFEGAYVGYPRSARFSVLVKSIVAECIRRNKKLDKQFVWMDIFGMNYAKLLDVGESQTEIYGNLSKGVSHFDSRWMFIDTWDDPQALTRMWIAWEVAQMTKPGVAHPIALFRPHKGEMQRPHLPAMIAELDKESIDDDKGGVGGDEGTKASRRRRTFFGFGEDKSSSGGDTLSTTDSSDNIFDEDDDDDDYNTEEEFLLSKGRVDAILRTVEFQTLACASKLESKALKAHTPTAEMKNALLDQCKTWMVQSTIVTMTKLRPRYEEMGLADILDQAGDLLLFILKEDVDRQTKQQKHAQHFRTAIKYYTEALAIYQRFKKDSRCANILAKIATVYEDIREYDMAISKYKKAFTIHKASNDPIMVAKTLSKIANVWGLKGKYDKALANYEQSCLLMILVKDKDPLLLADTIVNTANVLAYMRRYDQALKKFEQALLIRQEKLGANDPSVADILNSIANVQASQGNLDEALANYQKALEMYERAFGEQHITVFITLNNIAVVLNDQGQAEQALEILHQALALIAPGGHHSISSSTAESTRRASMQSGISVTSGNIRTIDSIPDVGTTYNNMAVCLESLRQFDKAMVKYKLALKLYQEQLGPSHPKVANILLNMGVSLLESQQKKAEAEDVLRQALQIYVTAYGESHPDTKECRAMLKRATS